MNIEIVMDPALPDGTYGSFAEIDVTDPENPVLVLTVDPTVDPYESHMPVTKGAVD